MTSAGSQLIAGRIPGERIATSIETSDSATFTTTETEIMSVTAAVVIGRTYRIRGVGRLDSTVDNDDVALFVREDSLAGSALTVDLVELNAENQDTSGQQWTPLEVEWTASSTGLKTFVISAQRNSGSGSIRRRAGSDRPAYLYVDYIRG